MVQDLDEMFGPESENVPLAGQGRSNGADNGTRTMNADMGLHARYVWEWKKRKVKL